MDNDVVKNISYTKKLSKLVLLREKNEVANRKIPNTSRLVTSTALNTKVTDVEKNAWGC